MVELRFKPAYKAQEEFMKCKKPFMMLSGAVRSGKSHPGCTKIITDCVRHPGTRALICRKNQSSLPESTWYTFMRLLPKALIVVDRSSEHRMFVTLRTIIPGVFSTVTFSGLDKKAGEEYPQKIGSREYGKIFPDEGSETDSGDWGMLITRLNHVPDLARSPEKWKDIIPPEFHDKIVAMSGGDVIKWLKNIYADYIPQIFTATNPDGPEHYLAKFFFEATPEEAKERAYWMSTPYDNRHNLPKGYIERLESTLTGVMRERLLLGQWKMATGLVYSTYDRSVHVGDIDFLRTEDDLIDYESYKDIIIGSDSNYPKPRAAIMIGCRGDGKYDVLAEFYQEYSHVEDAIRWMEERAEAVGRTIQVYHDPSDPSGIEKINSGSGLMCNQANNKVLPGISTVARHFADKTIKFSPHCIETLRELVSYRWKSGVQEQQPVKEKDHLMDALRYAIASYEDGSEEYFFLEDTKGVF